MKNDVRGYQRHCRENANLDVAILVFVFGESSAWGYESNLSKSALNREEVRLTK